MNAISPSPTISADQLSLQLSAKPTLYAEIRNAAERAYYGARQIYGITAGVDAAWKDFSLQGLQADRTAAPSPSGNLAGSARAFLAASAFFNDLASLNLPPLNALTIHFRPNEAGQIADTPEARALLGSRPSTKAWQLRRDQHRAQLEADRIAAEVAARELHERNAPQAFLDGLRARGIDIQLTDGGGLIAPAGTELNALEPGDLESAKRWKAQVVTILQAEADALKATRAFEPIVLA